MRDTETTAGGSSMAEGDASTVHDGHTDDLVARLDAAEARIDDLDAATQALRGFLGGVRAVNEDVERRAELALARTERLTRRLDGDSIAGVDASESPSGDTADDRADEPADAARDGRAGEAAENEASVSGLVARLRDLP